MYMAREVIVKYGNEKKTEESWEESVNAASNCGVQQVVGKLSQHQHEEYEW